MDSLLSFSTSGEAVALAMTTASKDISLKTGTNSRLFSRYPYMFSPAQLIALTDCIKSVSDVPGSFVEVGCAYGATTVFLNKFMNDHKNLAKAELLCD